MKKNQNPFLHELLGLRQDGSEAISAPSNWIKPPLLEVPTELDEVIEKIAGHFLTTRNKSNHACWHFFIGSPGNGKSACVGKLIRILHESGRIELREPKTPEGKSGRKFQDLNIDEIPYKLELFLDGKKYPYAWFAQDASVVEDPYSNVVNPANDLIHLLRDADKKGLSLIVCANRGVIERAIRENYLNAEVSKKNWFNVLKGAADQKKNICQKEIEFDDKGKKKVFNKFIFDYTNLDSRSLLKGDTLENLILLATENKKWEACESCEYKNLCPFKLNRIWLRNEKGRKGLLKLLQTAELLSGQVIVFREALSLISFILSGSPRDYDSSPCKWVENQIKSSNYFALLHRRIYMSLFSSHTHFGLESSKELRDLEVENISKLIEETREDNNEDICLTLNHVVNSNDLPSTDTSADRLLGETGILSKLDPIIYSYSKDFYDTWVEDFQYLLKQDKELITDLERKCIDVWERLENLMEYSTVDPVSLYWWLRRWTSSFTLRIGAMIMGIFKFENEIKDLTEILYSIKNFDELPDQLRSQLEDEIANLLGITTIGIKLSNNVLLKGNYIIGELSPELFENPNRLDLTINLGGQEISLTTEIYAWLKRNIELGMSKSTFPTELLEAARALVIRAAAHSKYAYQDRDVEIEVTKPDGEIVTLRRRHGSVHII